MLNLSTLSEWLHSSANASLEGLCSGSNLSVAIVAHNSTVRDAPLDLATEAAWVPHLLLAVSIGVAVSTTVAIAFAFRFLLPVSESQTPTSAASAALADRAANALLDEAAAYSEETASRAVDLAEQRWAARAQQQEHEIYQLKTAIDELRNAVSILASRDARRSQSMQLSQLAGGSESTVVVKTPVKRAAGAGQRSDDGSAAAGLASSPRRAAGGVGDVDGRGP